MRLLIVTSEPDLFDAAAQGAGLEGKVSCVERVPPGAAAPPPVVLVDGGSGAVAEGPLESVRAFAQAGVHVGLAAEAPGLAVALQAAGAGADQLLERPPSSVALAGLARCQAPRAAPFAPVAVPWLTPESGMVEVYRSAARLADTQAPLLLRGERGTGKEFLARAIHDAGPRAAGPFAVVHCGTLPGPLLDSELFGHEPAAVEGAFGRRSGRLVKAAGGTVLLDDLHRLPLRLQAKLLRVLTEGAVLPVGADAPVPVDVRMAVTVEEDPDALVARRLLLPELADLLAGGRLHLPPLRARGDEAIRALAEHFVAAAAGRAGRLAPAVSPDALEVVLRQAWPGNVRELRSVLERAVMECQGGVLEAVHFPPDLRQAGAPVPAPDSLLLEDMEKRHIARVLDMADGHFGRAAELLGIHRNTLRRKLKTYGMQD